MVNKKKIGIVAIIVLAILIIFTIFKTIDPFYTDDGKNRIYDEANLLTAEEKDILSKKINKYSNKRKFEIMIYTTNSDESNIEKLADDFYYNSFADGKSGVLLTLNMSEREFNIRGYYNDGYIDNNRADKLSDYIFPEIANGEYYKGMDKFINKSYKYLGVKPGLNPESIFFNNFILLGFSLLVGGIGVGSMLGGLLSNKPTGISYRNANNSRIIDKNDNFITTNVTRTKIVRNDNSGGSGGGGSSSGGSSSGGSSVSGSSSRKF